MVFIRERPRPSPLAQHARASAAKTRVAGGGCAMGDLFRLLGKSHMLDILHVFVEGPQSAHRFVDINRRLRISPNTLSERLKELVAAGFLTRTAFNEIPPRVDYAATAKAMDLKPIFETLEGWATRYTLKAPEQAPAPTAA